MQGVIQSVSLLFSPKRFQIGKEACCGRAGLGVLSRFPLVSEIKFCKADRNIGSNRKTWTFSLGA